MSSNLKWAGVKRRYTVDWMIELNSAALKSLITMFPTCAMT